MHASASVFGAFVPTMQGGRQAGRMAGQDTTQLAAADWQQHTCIRTACVLCLLYEQYLRSCQCRYNRSNCNLRTTNPSGLLNGIMLPQFRVGFEAAVCDSALCECSCAVQLHMSVTQMQCPTCAYKCTSLCRQPLQQQTPLLPASDLAVVVVAHV